MIMSVEVSDKYFIDSLARSRSTITWAKEMRVLSLRFIYGTPLLTKDSVIWWPWEKEGTMRIFSLSFWVIHISDSAF